MLPPCRLAGAPHFCPGGGVGGLTDREGEGQTHTTPSNGEALEPRAQRRQLDAHTVAVGCQRRSAAEFSTARVHALAHRIPRVTDKGP